MNGPEWESKVQSPKSKVVGRRGANAFGRNPSPQRSPLRLWTLDFGLWAPLLLLFLFSPLTTHAAGLTRTRADAERSDQFFSNAPIPFLKIEISATNLAALQRNNRAYARATLRDGETVYSEVGVHLKGSAGSVRDINDKPALTLNFDRFRDRQKFHGLDKIHLNNSVQDPSYLTELLCGDLFRAAGVPAARTTHATSTPLAASNTP